MTVFEGLILSHLFGDWLLQTEYEAMNKALGRFFNTALWKHCLFYSASFVPVFVAFHLPWHWLLLIFASHLFIDRRWPIVWWISTIKRTSKESVGKNFWLVVAVDQVVHVFILAFVVILR